MSETKKKQKYLRSQIIQGGYNGSKFMGFLQKEREDGNYKTLFNILGDDVNNWSMESLENVVSKFIENEAKNQKDKEIDGDTDSDDSDESPEEEMVVVKKEVVEEKPKIERKKSEILKTEKEVIQSQIKEKKPKKAKKPVKTVESEDDEEEQKIPKKKSKKSKKKKVESSSDDNEESSEETPKPKKKKKKRAKGPEDQIKRPKTSRKNSKNSRISDPPKPKPKLAPSNTKRSMDPNTFEYIGKITEARETTQLTDCKRLQVTIETGQVIKTGTFSKNFTSYTVKTKPFGWAVQRRFEDFLWLQTVLVKHFPTYLIPSCGKKNMGKDQDAVIHRIRFLQSFIDFISYNRELRSSDAFLLFVQNPKETLGEKKAVIEKQFSQVTDLRQIIQKRLIGRAQIVIEEIKNIDGDIKCKVNNDIVGMSSKMEDFSKKAKSYLEK